MTVKGVGMSKVVFICKEMGYLIKRHKLFILTPVLVALGLAALLVVNMETAVIVSFMYAGI